MTPAADHPSRYEDPDCAGCTDPFRGLPGVETDPHTCKVYGPSTPPDRARYVGETADDYSLRHEMRNA